MRGPAVARRRPRRRAERRTRTRCCAPRATTTRRTAIGLALLAEPPQIERLLRLARDGDVGSSVRSSALLAAVEVAALDEHVGAAVVQLTGDRSPDVRRTAIELLDAVGERGAQTAIALLRAGDVTAELLPFLARTVAASARALDFLLSHPEPEVSFAVIDAIGKTTAADAEARRRLVARLPDIVRALSGTPEMLAHASEAFGALAATGNAAYLRSVAVTPTLPTALRLAAVDAVIAVEALADQRPALLAAALGDPRSPVEFLRAVLTRVPGQDVADPSVKAAIRALGETHPSSWLREEARAKLQQSAPPSQEGALQIVSGIYGKDGTTVDVTRVLASMVVGGRLVVEAGNALAGDPLVNVVKELSVVYVWKGQRRTRTINEYETLTLP